MRLRKQIIDEVKRNVCLLIVAPLYHQFGDIG